LVDTDINVHDRVGDAAYKVIGRKSWVAYLGVLIKYGIYIGIFFYVNIHLATRTDFIWINDYIFYVYAYLGAFFIYRIAVLRSYKVSVTNEGVWLHYGIFPWAKSGDGLRWNDADMAFHYPNFISWITNSYTIKVNHKYTNTSDFMASKIWRGRKVCGEISAIQRDRLGV